MKSDLNFNSCIVRMLQVGLAAMLVMEVGCERVPATPLAPTFAVRGKVFDGEGKPLAGGIIQFIPETEPLMMSAAIAKDGTFELKTLQGNVRSPGGIEGKCRVQVTLPAAANKPPEVVSLPTSYEIHPHDNDIVIRLEAS